MGSEVTDHSLPTIKQELSRKSIETLEYLVNERKRGQITNDQYSVGLDVLFMTCNGIVESDFIDLVTLAGEEVEAPKPIKLKTKEDSWG